MQTHHGALEGVELTAELPERLRALGRGEGATLYMVLLGAFQALLARYAGRTTWWWAPPSRGARGARPRS